MTITVERRERAFQESLSFESFLEAMQVNRQTFETNYQSYQLSEAEKKFFAELPEPLEVLVLAHDWCGDVVANLPLFGKIERETNKLRLHILLRDPDNQDIAAAYLHPDGHNHIPTYVFFNQQGEELGVFIERPAEITTLMSGWVADFYTANPQFEGRGIPIGQLATPVKEALLTYLKHKRQQVRSQEQTAILAIIQQIATRISAVVGN